MKTKIDNCNTWIEISKDALKHNTAVFRKLAGPDRILTGVVKADAYGHGLEATGKAVLDAGADWLGVFSIKEGLALRNAGVEKPIIVLGPTGSTMLKPAVEANLKLTIVSPESAEMFSSFEGSGRITAHIKLETGTNRQGITENQLPATMKTLADSSVTVEGAYTHFADIEDTTEHNFACGQLARFERMLGLLRENGFEIPVPHTACTAATILFPETCFSMVRVGIGLYGLWPSRETLVSAGALGRNRLNLKPVMTWKTRISQIRNLSAGEFIGYGRTFRTTRETKLAVLPIGYSDGYDRRLSSGARVLVRGVRAPVIGRICMNLTMVDVTDIPNATPGDQVVLLGSQGDETVCAEDLAGLAGTINYEIVTRAAPGSPRFTV